MSLRTENAQLRDEVHSLIGQFHRTNSDLKEQVHGQIKDFHAATEDLKAQVADWRAATREFVWGNGGPRAKGEQAAASQAEEAPRPRKRPKKKAR